MTGVIFIFPVLFLSDNIIKVNWRQNVEFNPFSEIITDINVDNIKVIINNAYLKEQKWKVSLITHTVLQIIVVSVYKKSNSGISVLWKDENDEQLSISQFLQWIKSGVRQTWTPGYSRGSVRCLVGVSSLLGFRLLRYFLDFQQNSYKIIK